MDDRLPPPVALDKRGKVRNNSGMMNFEHARFWSRVEVAGLKQCWLWRAGRSRLGYGVFRYRGKNRRAHCVIWEMLAGPIPAGLLILHRCDNPPCVNPKHLFIGTQGENVRDAVAKGRYVHGETHGNSKLTDEIVVKIRDEAKAYGKKRCFTTLGKKYGVSRYAISSVVRGETWRHIPLTVSQAQTKEVHG